MKNNLVLTNDNVLNPVLQVLDDTDAKALVKLKETLTESWQTKQIFRTETEAKYSVLNHSSFPTKASRYWQSVREMSMQLEQIMLASFKLRRLQVDKKELEYKLESANGIEAERLQIDLDENLFHLTNLTQATQDRVREIQIWDKLKDDNDDGSFDKTDVNASQVKTMQLQLQNRARTLSNNSSGSEIQNVMGPLATLQADHAPLMPKKPEPPKIDPEKLKIQLPTLKKV